jgi:hypothetical protein
MPQNDAQHSAPAREFVKKITLRSLRPRAEKTVMNWAQRFQNQVMVWLCSLLTILVVAPPASALHCDFTRALQEIFESDLKPSVTKQKLLYPEFYDLLPTGAESKNLTETLHFLDLRRGRKEFRPQIIQEFYHLYQKLLYRPEAKRHLHEFYRAIATREFDEAKRYGELLRPDVPNIDDYLGPHLIAKQPRWIEPETRITKIKVGPNEIPKQYDEMRVLLISADRRFNQPLNKVAHRIEKKYGASLIASDEYVEAKNANAVFVRARMIEMESGNFVSRPLIVIPSSWLETGTVGYSLFHEVGHLERFLDRIKRKQPTLFDGSLRSEGIKNLRDLKARGESAYLRYFSFEEFEMQARDLTYASLGSEAEILKHYRKHEKIPAHQLFNFYLIQNKIKRLKSYLGATAEKHLQKVESQLELLSSGRSTLEPDSIQPWIEGEMWSLDLGEGIHFSLTLADPKTKSKIAQYRKNTQNLLQLKEVDPNVHPQLYYQRQSVLQQQQSLIDDLVKRAREYLTHHRNSQKSLQTQVKELERLFQRAAPNPDQGVYGAAWTQKEYLQAKDELSRVIRDLKSYSKEHFKN